MTEEELMTQLRLQGVENLDQVKAVYVEGNGQISVIRKPRTSGDEEGGAGPESPSEEATRPGHTPRRRRATASASGSTGERD
jgi:uncharacterized membrane protein YcaP (DUF421 family)